MLGLAGVFIYLLQHLGEFRRDLRCVATPALLSRPGPKAAIQQNKANTQNGREGSGKKSKQELER